MVKQQQSNVDSTKDKKQRKNIVLFDNDYNYGIHELDAITNLKFAELSYNNFRDVPESILINNLMDPNTFSFRRPYNQDTGKQMESGDFEKVSVSAKQYDKLVQINETFEKNPEFANHLINELRDFKLNVKHSMKGVKLFEEIVMKAQEQAERKKIKNPSLLLKGCDVAFLPKYDKGKNGYAGVELILKGFDALEVIEEPTIHNPELESYENDEPNLDGLFD